MNIIDVIVLLLILYGAVMGFKRGFTNELVTFVGFILVIIISYILKNPISEFLYMHFPFFKFGNILKGATVLNILIYEVISFVLVYSILMIILGIIILTTKIFEKILKYTIILGIPSKLLGLVVGVIHYYVVAFIFLFIISMPVFHMDEVKTSKFREPILKNTPVLSNIAKETLELTDKIEIIKEKYKSDESSSKFNLEVLDLFLEYKIISVDNVDKLIKNGKLNIEGSNQILEKYR